MPNAWAAKGKVYVHPGDGEIGTTAYVLTRDEAEALADRIKEEAAKIRKPGQLFPRIEPKTGPGISVKGDVDGDIDLRIGSEWTSLYVSKAKLLISQLQTLVDEAEGNNEDAATSFRLFDTWSSLGGYVEGDLVYLETLSREGDRTVVRFNKAHARALASYISGLAQQLP